MSEPDTSIYFPSLTLCSNAERLDFLAYDDKHHIRATMIEALKKEFPHLKMTYSIGGQISFDVFPEGKSGPNRMKLTGRLG